MKWRLEIEQELGLRQYQAQGDLRLWHAKGCTACGHTGYKGRSAIHEILVRRPVTPFNFKT